MALGRAAAEWSRSVREGEPWDRPPVPFHVVLHAGRSAFKPTPTEVRLPAARTKDYDHRVSDTWIALDGHARRRSWLWIGAVALAIAGLTGLTYLPRGSAAHPSHFTAAGHWWWIGVFGSAWLAYGIYLLNRSYGSTKLSASGMQFETVFSRRFIAWGEITKVQKHHHQGRGTSWLDIAVHIGGSRTGGHIPGTLTFGSGPKATDVLTQKLETIRSYWRSATNLDVSDRG